MVPQRELFIGGAWVPPAGGRYLDVVNPATESVIGRIPAADHRDVQHAVSAASQAHSTGRWANTSGVLRAVVLRAIASKVYVHNLNCFYELAVCIA